jgi:hypothetical protein
MIYACPGTAYLPSTFHMKRLFPTLTQSKAVLSLVLLFTGSTLLNFLFAGEARLRNPKERIYLRCSFQLHYTLISVNLI